MTSSFDPALAVAAQEMMGQLVAWRRDLHRHPELAFQEHRTAGLVAGSLAQLGLEVQTGVGQTGVVGILEGARPGPTVLLRFDMDALPINEETGLTYKSEVAGKMHACGHDAHTAIGLGVATLLASRQDDLPGRVKFMFQPAEEIAGGARAMIADGVLETPVPDAAFGLHVWSMTAVGQAVVKGGPLWASADKFDVEITGRGAHGALPHQGVDAIVVAAHAITQLQTVVSRSIDPLEPAVLSIGEISGGSAFNVIAERVMFSGTLRTFDQAVRELIIQRMHKVFGGVCAAFGASYALDISFHAPPLVNDPDAAEHVRRIAAEILGADAVADGPMLTVAEDMAEILNRVPGCFFVLGAMPDRNGLPAEPHHSPRFEIDEQVMPLGVAILAGVAEEYLRRRRW
ncbi:MAG: amidohydrolase [Anaerolineae bacterium]|nr:amidohydrolase [Anaerolineae bacterium]MCB9129968.1 amidohydrolase [Anaerolineales bacterium]MCB0235338.1 amidohydrolase [Anaerolineae bacterium]MCB0240496.1 amidohydrolase [Anaerolineae bacterium]MCB0245159.1 amidohydrolase [Anaerolineae bacterium]